MSDNMLDQALEKIFGFTQFTPGTSFTGVTVKSNNLL